MVPPAAGLSHARVSAMEKNEFAARRFAAAVRTRRGERSLREAAAEIGTVSPATLLRLEQEEVRPDLPTFLRICDWLQVSPGIFLHGEEKSGAQLLTAIERELRTDGVLPPSVIAAFMTLVRAVRQSASA